MTDIDSPPRSPATIFLELWQEARSWGASQRAEADRPGTDFSNSVKRALLQPELEEVTISIDRLCVCSGLNGPRTRGRRLAIMREIDRFFLSVHPRCAVVSGLRNTPPVPYWLEVLRDWRLHSSGWYAENGAERVVARGPLTRAERGPTAAYAERLADRFAALTVVPKKTKDADGRDIAISLRVIDGSALTGVPSGGNIGTETITFLPVTETLPELQITQRSGSGFFFVDFRTHPDVDVPERVISALGLAGPADIAIAPEFTITAPQSDRLGAILRSSETEHARLIVAGSGQSIEVEEGRPWNEARVLNAFGVELWKQRKIWPASIVRAKAASFGLSDPGDAMIQEDTASGREILVVDIDTLGRAVILICQDLKAQPLPGEIIQEFQPDWVFCPILDSGISSGRWAHQSAFEFSRHARSRILIVSSTALIPGNAKSASFGLAIGPCDSDADDADRMCAEVVRKNASPEHATVTWRSENSPWKKTTIGTESDEAKQ